MPPMLKTELEALHQALAGDMDVEAVKAVVRAQRDRQHVSPVLAEADQAMKTGNPQDVLRAIHNLRANVSWLPSAARWESQAWLEAEGTLCQNCEESYDTIRQPCGLRLCGECATEHTHDDCEECRWHSDYYARGDYECDLARGT